MIPAEWAADFQQWKTLIVDHSGLAKDALHIYAGMAVFVAVRLLWQTRFGWGLAWISVLALALGAEYLDLVAERSDPVLRPDAAHWHDIWNTMFWPTVLAIFGRWMVPRTVVSPVMPIRDDDPLSLHLTDQSP